MMNGKLSWMIPALALSACAPTGGLDNDSARVTADAIALRSTTALSLAELAYNSGETAATAAITSGALTPADDAAIGAAVHRARAYRDEARMIVDAGGDASATIEALDDALRQIGGLAASAQR